MHATAKAREYFRRYKEQTLAIVSKDNGASREVDEPDDDSIVATTTPDGSLPESVQAADTGVRAKLIGVPMVRPLTEVFDYHFAQAAYAELARTGWQPEP